MQKNFFLFFFYFLDFFYYFFEWQEQAEKWDEQRELALVAYQLPRFLNGCTLHQYHVHVGIGLFTIFV